MMRRRGWPVQVAMGVLGVGLLVAAPGPVPATGVPAGGSPPAGAPVSGVSVAGADYRLVDLGTLGRRHSQAYALNDRGQVVGNASTRSGDWHAFLWDPVTGMTDLGTLGGRSRAVAVNEWGQAVGYSYTALGDTHAVLWDPVAGMTDLGTLGGDHAVARDLNERGQVAGSSYVASGHHHAFLWDPVSGMNDLGSLGGDWSAASAVNDRGQVVGNASTQSGDFHAFLWDPVSGMTDLGTLGGGSSDASDVNEAGQVAGSSATASGEEHAFLWDPVTGMTDLGTLGGTSKAEAVNERGQAAGHASTGAGSLRTFVWDPVTGMTDLGPGYGEVAINERGQVAAWGYTESMVQQTFLWDPVAGMTDLSVLGGTHSDAFAVNDMGQVVGSSDHRAVLWTPVALAPQVRVKVAKAGYGNKLRVNVDPDRVRDSWKFRVQKRTAGVWKTLPTVYWTRGTGETRKLTLGPGRFRVKVLSRYGYTGVTSAAVRLTRKTVRVHVGSDAARTRLRVNVDPNKGSGYWTFRVQRQRADRTWRTLPRTYTTRGNQETRTLNRNKGTYRVKVQTKYGYRGTTSSPVTLHR